MSLTTELSTKDNGLRMVLGMEEVFKFGKMGQSTRVTGVMTWPMVRVASFIVMVMFTKVSGSTTKLTVKELTFIWMVLSIPASGLRTSNMDTVSRPGLIVLAMKETTSMVKNTEQVPSSGPTAQCS